MRLIDRLKRVKKLIGSDIVHTYQDEFFTPTKPTANIVGIHVYSLYDIRLVVEIEGVLSPLNTTKKYNVTRRENVPLIKIHLGKMLFPIYPCLSQKTRTIFITKNDIDSSLIKTDDYSPIEEMERALSVVRKNIAVKKNFVCKEPIRAISRIFKVSEAEAISLNQIGLTPFGWRTTLEETNIFNPHLFDIDIIHEINESIEEAEKLAIYLGILKISKQKYKK